MLKKSTFILLINILLTSYLYPVGIVNIELKPQYIDLSAATSQSAILVNLSNYPVGSAPKYRLYNGSNQYSTWDGSSYISSSTYSVNPTAIGDYVAGTSFWIVFQRGSNNSTTFSYRDRLSAYGSNNNTITGVSFQNSMSSSYALTGALKEYGVYMLSSKYVILGYDAEADGNLLCATSSELSSGTFSLACPGGLSIKRIEIRTLDNITITKVLNSSGWSSGSNLGEVVLPVELSSFTAMASEKAVNLSWTTATEVNNYGFEVERSVYADNDFQTIGFVQGNGNSNSPKQYSYSDNTLAKPGRYYYRLKQLDNDGRFEYSSVAEVNFTTAPADYSLKQNTPNPFNPSTVISFVTPKDGNVTLKVYNMIGQEVATLFSGFKSAGEHRVTFNGQGLNSGIYLYRLETENFSAVKKMTLVK